MPRSAGPVRSMRSTVAPRSASSMAANGPGPMPARSTILRPGSGPISIRLEPDGLRERSPGLDILADHGFGVGGAKEGRGCPQRHEAFTHLGSRHDLPDFPFDALDDVLRSLGRNHDGKP